RTCHALGALQPGRIPHVLAGADLDPDAVVLGWTVAARRWTERHGSRLQVAVAHSRQGEEVDPDHGPDHVDLRPDGWDVVPWVSYGRAVRQSHLRLEPHRQADARWQHRLPGDASHRPGPGSTRRELPAISPIPRRLLFGKQADDTLLRVVCVDVHERGGQSPGALHGRGNSLSPDPKHATRPPRRLRPQRPPRRLLHRSRILGALLKKARKRGARAGGDLERREILLTLAGSRRASSLKRF